MPRPSRPWFRVYTEMFGDPKLRRMPVAYRWVWMAVLGAARMSCVPGVLLVSENEPLTQRELADLASVQPRCIKDALARMDATDMIQWNSEYDAWEVTRWSERQFESDLVTERTRKHRSKEQGRNVPGNDGWNVPGNTPDTETDTEMVTRGDACTYEPSSNGSPPGPRCPAHADLTGPVPPCGDCADARRAHTAAQPPPVRTDPHAEQQAIALAKAEKHQAEVHQLHEQPPDPDAAAKVAALRAQHHLGTTSSEPVF